MNCTISYKIQWQTFSLSQSVTEKETQNAMINTGIQCLLIILDSYAYRLCLVCFLLCWNEIMFGNKTMKSAIKRCFKVLIWVKWGYAKYRKLQL